MKNDRSPPSGLRREQRMKPLRDDSYRADAKMPDPATCPECHAAYLKGRWTWREVPAGAARQTCPACRRIAERMPAGFLTLSGPFFADHRDEVLGLVTARAARAREEHPMQRLIGVAEVAGGVEVTTTDAILARTLATAVHKAYKGELEVRPTGDEKIARATWSR
ncbi:MAG TPA: BCAM0308 family protein [Myxococcota bacterium]|nr:BCAM0308 family protein [Myxococcota bacterium]